MKINDPMRAVQIVRRVRITTLVIGLGDCRITTLRRILQILGTGH
jgi:hypothetical protein